MPDLTAIKIRLYPNDGQKDQLDRTFGCCRFLWNQMLAEHQQVYHRLKADKPALYAYHYKTERQYKAEFPFLKAADSITLEATREHLDAAYQNFFDNWKLRKEHKTKRYVGLPRFKSKRKADQTFTTKYVNGNIKIDFATRKLKLPKMATWIAYADDRVFTATIRRVTVSKTKSGHYFAAILIKRDAPVAPLTAIHEAKAIGFDMSMHDFLVTKEYKLQNPRFFRQSLNKIKKAHRKVSRSANGSKNRVKACRKLATVYDRYVHQKHDWMYQIARRIVNMYDAVILEDLNIKGMSMFNTGYAKSVTKDFSWGEFTRILAYQLAWAGKHYVEIDRYYPSSQLCSVCGYQYHELTLAEREWTCPQCHTQHDRDVNASENIKQEGLRLLQSRGITLIRATGGTPESYVSEDYVRPLLCEAVVNERETSNGDVRIHPL